MSERPRKNASPHAPEAEADGSWPEGATDRNRLLPEAATGHQDTVRRPLGQTFRPSTRFADEDAPGPLDSHDATQAQPMLLEGTPEPMPIGDEDGEGDGVAIDPFARTPMFGLRAPNWPAGEVGSAPDTADVDSAPVLLLEELSSNGEHEPLDADGTDTELAPPALGDALETEPTRIDLSGRARGVVESSAETAPWLVVVGGNDRGKRMAIGVGELTIGRGLDNGLVLADIAVSRRHTVIHRGPGGCMVRDLGSGNGTLLNGDRVTEQWLQDGDTIDLGTTQLRFEQTQPLHLEATAAASPLPAPTPTQAPSPTRAPPAQLAPVLTVAEPVDSLLADVVGTPVLATAAVVPPPRAHQRAARRGGSRRLLLIGGGSVVGLLALMLLLKLALLPRAPSESERRAAASAKATQSFAEARRLFKDRRWEEARQQYYEVVTLAPGFDEARRYARQASAEIAAREALRQAKDALIAGHYTVARGALARIPVSSIYFSELDPLKRRIDREEVDKLVTAARERLAAADFDGALKQVREARRIQPTLEQLGLLQTEIEQARPVAAAPRGRDRGARRRLGAAASSPAPAPRTSDHDPRTKAALARYRARDWAGAYALLDQQARSLAGARARAVRELAGTVRGVGQALEQAQRVQLQDGAAALKHYEAALRLDARLRPPVHQEMIRELIHRLARVQASAALSGKRFGAAFAAVTMAQRYGPLDPSLKRVLERLEVEAMTLFDQGYTLRESDPARARAIWQRVLQMVPPSSRAYQKAYTWINSSAPRYTDEDEDG
ncbi:MAG: FHA domain-containing protein [Proteobacteria bacterium]|nr:FHA domain-containing protein [Pseudomonadota bacterium]